jgi:exonuclease SbcC
MKDHPDKKALVGLLGSIQAAVDDLEARRADEATARSIAEEARELLDRLKEDEHSARTAFDTARDTLVPLEPPPAARKDLAADWDGLLRWAITRRTALAQQAEAVAKATQQAQAKLDRLNSALMSSCAECELDVPQGKLVETVVAAHTQATNEVTRIEDAMKDAAAMRSDIKTLRLEQETNHQLAKHLSHTAGMFESWIVNAALERLVQGATEILQELSDEQYALAIDEKGNFQIVDRHNANETRSARTLSGGETFLTSLALALALADQLAELAAGGSAHLDAIFLDEGFGTLDEETLRTVADTVEKLASHGRMVGIVTHVRELAEAVPIKFRVVKDIKTSTVTRMSA